MGARSFARPRCGGCGLHLELCLCDEMPRLELRTRIVVVQNNHERNKPTNTGRLVPMLLRNAELLRYAVRGEPFDPGPLLDPGTDYHLLFPREDATELQHASWRARDRSQAVVVLDGTWAQCSRMSRRVPVVSTLPCLSLPPGPPTHWGVRTTNDPSRLSTLDAVIRVVALAEGPGPARVLAAFFDRLAARMLFMKAKLRSPEVPDAWRRVLDERWPTGSG
ncbi:MAG: DTW domain-containing protein [Myxococcales bacterium FL481]|nr:MAG: DTW domain-containing protein [Myxococcales bacterium FL481]